MKPHEMDDESVNLDLSTGFVHLWARLLEIEATSAVLLRYQARILSHLESQKEEEIRAEMREKLSEIHKEKVAQFSEVLGFSKKYSNRIRHRGESKEQDD